MVILVITVVSAMVIPELRGSLDEALLRASARQITGACDVAYTRAVAAGRTHHLRLDPATGRYHVESDPAPGPGRAAGKVDAPDASGTLDPRVTVRLVNAGAPDSPVTPPRPPGGADANAVGFHADGTADPAEFLLQDRSGFRLALRINPVTARVRVRDLGRP